jgi:benzoyl-CoA reductase/2-hydroxyglutaryl-CoA dehydratase subunit BcrC/BadD/HgdB
MGAGVPPEIIWPFNIAPIFGEPFSATCNFFPEFTTACLRAADKAGYYRDLCGYSRTFIGCVLQGQSPFGELPVPDFIANIKSNCTSHFQWWLIASRLTQQTPFFLDTPYIGDRIEEYHIAFFMDQLERFIHFLEESTHTKLEEDKLIKGVVYAQEAVQLWDEILEYCKVIPSPVAFKHLLTLMVPAALLRGTPEAVKFYQKLKAEIADRVANQISGIPDEKYRLIWFNVPLWYNLGMFHQLEKVGATCVVSPYTGMWGNLSRYLGEENVPSFPWPPTTRQEALRVLAISWIGKSIFNDFRLQFSLFRRMIEEFHIDGIIAHSNRGCKGIESNGMLGILNWVQKNYNLPILVFESNSTDPEEFSQGQFKVRLEAFLEVLEQRTVKKR